MALRKGDGRAIPAWFEQRIAAHEQPLPDQSAAIRTAVQSTKRTGSVFVVDPEECRWKGVVDGVDFKPSWGKPGEFKEFEGEQVELQVPMRNFVAVFLLEKKRTPKHMTQK